MSYYNKYLKYKYKYLDYKNKLSGGSKEYEEGLDNIRNGNIQLAIDCFNNAIDKKYNEMALQHLFDIYSIGREGVNIDLCKADYYLEKIKNKKIKDIMLLFRKYYFINNNEEKNNLKISFYHIQKDFDLSKKKNKKKFIKFKDNKYVKYMKYILGYIKIDELHCIEDVHELSLIKIGDNYKKEENFIEAIKYYKKAAKRGLLQGIYNSGELMAEYSNDRKIIKIFFDRTICDCYINLPLISKQKDDVHIKITEYLNNLLITSKYWLIKLGEYVYIENIIIDYTKDKFIIDVSNIDYQIKITQEVLYSLTNQDSSNKLNGYIIHSYLKGTSPMYMRIPNLNELYFEREPYKKEPTVVDQTVSAAINYEGLNTEGVFYIFSGDGNCDMDGLKGKNYFSIYRSVKNLLLNRKKVYLIAIEGNISRIYYDLKKEYSDLEIMFLSDFIKSTIKPDNFFILTLEDKRQLSDVIDKVKQFEEICPKPSKERSQSPPPSKERSQSPPPSKERSQSPPPSKERSQSPPPSKKRSKSQPSSVQIGSSKSKPREFTLSPPFGWTENNHDGITIYNSPLCEDIIWKEGNKPWII